MNIWVSYNLFVIKFKIIYLKVSYNLFLNKNIFFCLFGGIFYFIVLWCVCGFFRDDVRDYDILFIGCKMFGNL